MDHQPIVEQLSQLLRSDWDNRSTMGIPLLPLALGPAPKVLPDLDRT